MWATCMCLHSTDTFWFCGWHNFLLPYSFTCCLRWISASLSFSQHFYRAFRDTMNATCPIPRLLHGKIYSLAPPAALTLLTPSKMTTTVQRQQIFLEATFSSLLFPLSPYCMDRWQKHQQAGREWELTISAGALPLSYSWSTATKAAKPPLTPSLQLLSL